jgi:uncharacterized membrane protein
VITWGYYGVLGRIVLPALARSIDRSARAAALAAIERRALPLLLLSGVLFTATGTYLLVVDPHYGGLGNFFLSSWTMLMLVKHILVIGFVALAVIVDRLVGLVDRAPTDLARRAALRRLELTVERLTGLGAVIALVTAAAQLAT